MNQHRPGYKTGEQERTQATDPQDRAEAKAERAQAESLAKSEFLAGLSHELRTPLNGLLGMVELMQHANDPHDRERYATFARKCAAMIDELVDDILEFSRAESGQLTFRRVPFSPREVTLEAEQLLLPLASAKGLWLHSSLADDLPQRLRGDPGRLRQVIVNLLGNAIKFTERGDVHLTMGGEQGDAGRYSLQVQVNDTGRGIPAASLQRIFLPFTRLEEDLEISGTGLGLTLCKQIVEGQGGQLGVDSEPDLGSRFWFSLEYPLVED